uniref:RING-type E3 ubiquitin transferase n=1 Tax=Opuntia streptacantha TaxID=393608 RepID=A0A7C9EBW4_OPUST
MESSSSSGTSQFPLSHRRHQTLKQPSWSRISDSIKDKTCPICLSHIAGHRPAVIAACFHAYCLACLLRWSKYKRTCPLCNSHIDSYFTAHFFPSSRTVQKHRLPLFRPPPDHSPGRRESDTTPMAVERVLRRTREEINAANRRSRPVPRRRSFRRLGSLNSEEITERILQWRASIYRLGLLAVPFKNRNPSNPNMAMSTSCKEQILQRIEPWIRRELQAILHDPDPTIIVHVAASLYLSSIEKKPRFSDSDDTLLAPLRPFLHEWMTTFWHELRKSD